jgi:hypothetical protein
MNKRDNPYTPGAGRKPRTMAGREEDLDAFQALVDRLDSGSFERSLVYNGLRGVGKTVLLMEFDVLASEAGLATTDVAEVGSQPDFRITFARMAARLLTNMSRRHRAKELIDRALSVVKVFSLVAPGRLMELRLEVDAASGVADSGDPESDLGRPVGRDRPGRPGQPRRRAVLDRRDAEPRRALPGGHLHRLPGGQQGRSTRGHGWRRAARPSHTSAGGQTLGGPPVRLPQPGRPPFRGGQSGPGRTG